MKNGLEAVKKNSTLFLAEGARHKTKGKTTKWHTCSALPVFTETKNLEMIELRIEIVLLWFIAKGRHLLLDKVGESA